MGDDAASTDAGLFAMPGHRSLLHEEHLGIINGMLTANVLFRDVLSFRGLWAPPFASDLQLQIRLCGERVPTQNYVWNPNACERSGVLGDLEVRSELVLPMRQRGGLLAVTVRNLGAERIVVPVQISACAALERTARWEFDRPVVHTAAPGIAQGPLLTLANEQGAITLAADLEQPVWEAFSSHWEAALSLEPGETRCWHLAFAIGERAVTEETARTLVALASVVTQEAREERAAWVADLFGRLPRFSASDDRLVSFYNRSLVHLLLNQWHVPELVLDPYYSTGGINGGCVCCYLWDFSEAWELLPLYDPNAVREHIRRFLSSDLTRHFAFEPTTGEAFGPWYPVNQEKIIFLVYHYVLLTGDRAFLQEQVAGRTVLEWVLYHATYGDLLQRPVTLIDYGAGNNHLELRKKERYDHYLPDLNARRYTNYLAAHCLAGLAGVPAPHLLTRAGELRTAVRDLLWSPALRWFVCLGKNHEPTVRYTVQILKLIGSDVLDQEQLAGVLSHLNESEFLSAYGLHSMSKQDPAYDQVDIDNGGGGICSAFAPQIIERLYRAGQPEIAEDILRRILWWGDRLPYWSDSLVANQMEYRHDTPLQNAIGALAGAQSIIFGMFGVQVRPDGALVVNPRPPSFSPEISLAGLRIGRFRLDIEASARRYCVTSGNGTFDCETGVPLVLPFEVGT
jgi:hypothetical protein